MPPDPFAAMAKRRGRERSAGTGARIRGRFRLDSIEEKAPGQLLFRHTVTVEIEGEEKPALTAEWLGLLFV